MKHQDSEVWVTNGKGPMIRIPTAKEISQAIEAKVARLYDTLNRLQEENDRLKSEAYKDEELAKMKENLECVKKSMYRGFPISEKEEKAINEWKKKLRDQYANQKMDVMGTRFKYEFVPTAIGVSGTIIDCNSGEKFEFQELG